MAIIQIAPSLLSANLAALGEEVRKLEAAGANRLHFDIMDGHFVPNLTFGSEILKALRPLTSLAFEAHLMVTPCDPYLDSCSQAGADIILIHPESGPHLHRSLQKIKAGGKKAGVILNPATPLSVLEFVGDLIDQILVMTVNPGFGGQTFIEGQLSKIQAVKKFIGNRPIDLEVDGGITPETASACIKAGATVLVAGTSVFKTPDYKANIAALRL